MSSLADIKPSASASAPATGRLRGLRRSFNVLWRRVRGGEQSRTRTALAIALGLFVGCLPLYGLHFPICLAICLAVRLDFVIAYLAANISNPFIAPFLLTIEVEIGSLILSGEHAAFTVERATSVGITGFAAQALVGGIATGALFAAVGAAVAYAFAGKASRRTRAELEDPLEAAIFRTIARYRAAPIADRAYVANKLRYDPVLECIVGLEMHLGSVIDAGAGRGQLSLCLLELGRAKSVCGFDFDARKVNVARRAAGADARYLLADLSSAVLDTVDTILLVDVLHYLRRRDQDLLLYRAVSALAYGGRLIVRDVQDVHGLRSRITQLFERLAVRIRYNRTRAPLTYRSSAEIVEILERLGCRCRVISASDGTPFANVLIVAERA